MNIVIHSDAPLPWPADPARAERGILRWLDAAGREPDTELRAFATALADDPVGRRLLDALFGNSPYLGGLALQEMGFLRDLLRDGPDATFAALMAGTAQDTLGTLDMAALMKRLRVAKRRSALLIAVADIALLWDLARVTGALSDMAETALRAACDHLLRRAHDAGDLILPDPARPSEGSGLIVLGMGKLGARELNYSSDIDLIIFYDDGLVRTERPDRLQRTFVRLARDLVRIMDERTADGYVFRTDLRLRPDPGATPVAISVTAAEIYYGSLGQNWERAAMIKARPVAGDVVAGRRFMRLLDSFVWRRNLDFAAIQDIHSIKRQIHAHKGHRAATVNGHNVKIGRGGIREIEFFAQTQQLIYGGRDPLVRAPATLAALEAFVESGHVQRATADELAEAYGFLRRLEHRLQMVEDQQTHSLPKSDGDVAAIAVFMGYDDPERFRQDLLHHMGRVEDHYAHLFEEAPPLAGPGNLVFTGAEDDPETLQTLRRLGFAEPSAVAAIIRAWHHGRYRATRSQKARELLTELVPTILECFGRTLTPDGAFARFDEFMSRLPTGVQIFSLFYANPQLLPLLAEIMGTAPRLADLLSRRPELLDHVLSADFFGLTERPALEADFTRRMQAARDFEDALGISRRWVHEHQFQAGVQILRAANDGDRIGLFLADVADIALDGLLARVRADFAVRHGTFPDAEVAVVAMGKLGGREMSVGSDLDIIMVYDTRGTMSDGPSPLAPSQYFIRLCQRFVNAMTALTPDGRLYEVDMRLRPSGNAGPLAVSLDSFMKYQRENAWTWEHMALTRARPVAGHHVLMTRLDEEITAVVALPRPPDRLLRDVADMRARIAREFQAASPWDVKYLRGGFVDIEFLVQYLQLRHACENPKVRGRNTAHALERLAAAGFLEPGTAADLAAALRLCRRVQAFLRVTIGSRADPTGAPAVLQSALARAAFPEADPPLDFQAATGKLQAAADLAYAHFRATIEEPAAALPKDTAADLPRPSPESVNPD